MSEAIDLVNNKSLSENNQLCGFRIGDGYYAISVLDVQEVIKPQRVTAIPLAPPYIRGLINLRGQIVTQISLKKLFGMEENIADDHMNIIVSRGESLYALVVDEILDVIDVEGSTFSATPDTIDPKVRGYIRGVYKLEKRLQILIDLDKIIDIETE